MKDKIKYILQQLVYLLFLIFTVTLLLEISYRYYWFDFYRGNLEGLNSQQELKANDERNTILVIGDSFSADQKGYVNNLRKQYPEQRIINAAVYGTGIRQHRLFIQKRIKAFKPKLLIYQIYVGNDLLDFKHPWKSEHISFFRKLYWWLTDRILVIGYINSRLPQLGRLLSGDVDERYDPKTNQVFQPNQYNARSKLILKAEPDLISKSVLLQGDRAKDMDHYLALYQELMTWIPDDCQLLTVVIPHCTQVSDHYIQQYKKLGGQFSSSHKMKQIDYPFYHYIDSIATLADYPTINPLKTLQIFDTLQPAFYPNDPHLNKWGQEAILKSIKPFINDKTQ